MAVDGAFIGVDLAWQSEGNHTGAIVLFGDADGAELKAGHSPPIQGLSAVRQFISDNSLRTTVVAIDAPLIINNTCGQRPCETAIGQRYGARQASCHTSNLSLYPDAASLRLAASLAAGGYIHAPEASIKSRNVMLEMYTHAALVALFDLPKVLKYKKGRLTQRRAGLQTLADHILNPKSLTGALRLTPSDRALQRKSDLVFGGEAKARATTWLR